MLLLCRRISPERMKKLLLFLAILVFKSSFAQVETPLNFTSEDDNKVVKETDSGKYYTASKDADLTVYIGEDPMTYRLFDKDNVLLVEGTLVADGDKYLHQGKWTEYYGKGKVKASGYYVRDRPMGNWRKYYPSGKLMSSYTYAPIENSGTPYYCMAGSYQEYYENGQLKVNGFYKAVIDENSKDTVVVQDPMTGNDTKKIVKGTRPRPEKYGTWEYYGENGELTKKEDL